MKHLVWIIHVDLKLDTADFLHNIEGVKGFTFTSVEWHGLQSEADSYLSDRDKVIGHTPRVRVDILLEDKDVTSVLTSLRKSNIGSKKQGIYWITAVEEYNHL